MNRAPYHENGINAKTDNIQNQTGWETATIFTYARIISTRPTTHACWAVISFRISLATAPPVKLPAALLISTPNRYSGLLWIKAEYCSLFSILTPSMAVYRE